jgi:hypothetical protein
MGLVSSSIPNLLNGVSQQPAPLRQPTQAEIQENGLSDVADGLKKRPHTSYKATFGLTQGELDTALIYHFEYEEEIICIVAHYDPTLSQTKYRLFKSGQGYKNFTPQTIFTHGSEVVYNSGDYLYTTNPKRDLQILTAQELVLILNRTVMVSDSGTIGAGTLNAQLYNSFSDLPDGVGSNAVVGNTYKIIGAATSAFDSYYVKALSSNTYEETRRPGEKYAINPHKMPHAIYPHSNNSWIVGQYGTWGFRTCGDSDSAPFPSFVGQKIEAIFYFKNRLGILAGGNVVFSESGDPYNFFPKTVTTILDDAPIDVALKDTGGTTLKHAVVFNDTLTIFSNSKQFKVDTNGPLTQQTISVVPSTDFESNTNISPVGAQNVLYFTTTRSGHTSIKEYFIEADTVRSDAIELTAHVPKYIPADLKDLVTSESNDLLMALTNSGRVFVYKYFTDGEKKLQASWSEWIFPSVKKVLNIYANGDFINFVAIAPERTASDNVNGVDYTNTANDLVLMSMDFSQPLDSVQATNTVGNIQNFTALLDNKHVPAASTVTYSASDNETKIEVPEVLRSSANASNVVILNNTTGKLLDAQWWLDPNGVIDPYRYLVLNGQYTHSQLTIGYKYDFKYRLSPQYVRENNGAQAVQSGRLQMKSMRVGFEDTGYFKVEVTPNNRATSSYEFTGQVINQIGSTVGLPSLSDGTFKFPVLSKNDTVTVEIKSDSFLPCTFQTIEWEGFYTIRSKRI